MLGALRLELTEVFLSELDREEIRKQIETKIRNREDLEEKDMMQLIIYPLMFRGDKAKQEAIRDVLQFSGQIEDFSKQKFVLKMLLAFTDKFIKDEDARKIQEVIKMTKVERLFEEEKQQAVNEAVEKAVEKAVEENTKTTEANTSKRIALNLLSGGISEDKVASCTGLSLEVVRELALKAV